MHTQKSWDSLDDDAFVPMTAAQVQILRNEYRSLSPWSIVIVQVIVGLTLAMTASLISQRIVVGVSVGCGALAVVLPGALFARGLTGRFASFSPANAVTSFFVWEFVKIVGTVAVLFGAHRWVNGLNWPAMLVGLVLTLKVYWLALLFNGKRHPVED
jgi:ATP synthase protein I